MGTASILRDSWVIPERIVEHQPSNTGSGIREHPPPCGTMVSCWLNRLNGGLATPTGRIAQLIWGALSRNLVQSSQRRIPGESTDGLPSSEQHFLLFSAGRGLIFHFPSSPNWMQIILFIYFIMVTLVNEIQ